MARYGVARGPARSNTGNFNLYDAHLCAALRRRGGQAARRPEPIRRAARPARRGGTPSCRERGVRYSSFWTLTGNKKIVEGRAVREVAKAHGCTCEQAWMAFVSGGLGISPLSGTTSEAHMRQDLQLPTLTEREVERLSYLIG